MTHPKQNQSLVPAENTPKIEISESAATEEKAFEMIELAIGDFEALTKAFDLIGEICDELAEETELSSDDDEPFLIH